MRRATAYAGLSLDDWCRQPAGDGELAVLPEGVHEPRVIGTLLDALAARLREYNRCRVPELRVRLRIAVHHGLIHLDGATGYPGRHAVAVARLLDSSALRNVLRERRGVNLAAIVSDEVFQDVVANRYEDLRPELFLAVQVDDPVKRFSARAWLYAPEEDVTLPVRTGATRPFVGSVGAWYGSGSGGRVSPTVRRSRTPSRVRDRTSSTYRAG
jgi:hypothetical protein